MVRLVIDCVKFSLDILKHNLTVFAFKLGLTFYYFPDPKCQNRTFLIIYSFQTARGCSYFEL